MIELSSIKELVSLVSTRSNTGSIRDLLENQLLNILGSLFSREKNRRFKQDHYKDHSGCWRIV